jgi:hypothetical protein
MGRQAGSKRFFLGLKVLVVCVACRIPALADRLVGEHRLSLYGGFGYSPTEISMQSGGSDRISNAGGAFGGQYVYHLQSVPALGFGLDFSYSRLEEHSSAQVLNLLNTQSDARSLIGLGIVKWRFPGKSIHPYVFAGAGFHRTSFYLDGQPIPGAYWLSAPAARAAVLVSGSTNRRTLIDGSATAWAASGGYGMDIDLGNFYFVGAELRSTWLGKATYSPTPAGAAVVSPISGNFFLWNGFLRFGIRFGGPSALGKGSGTKQTDIEGVL